MDIAKSFKPKTIFLLREISEHPEAQRILSLFPSADIKVIEHQQNPPISDMSLSKTLLAGKRTLMIGKSTSFVGHFDGRLGENIRCRPYYKLVPVSNGCPYYCTYCYLAYVYRKFFPFIKININHETMFRQIRKAADRTGGNISFNMGEMLDSLALDHITNLTLKLILFFSQFTNAYLMLLTKSSNIKNLLTVKSNKQIILSWSLNSSQATCQYEPGTASLEERIEAALQCREHGYRIRFRIDPGILHPDWQDGYADLIRKSLTAVKPENITLGMLRLLPGHFKLAKDAYGRRARQLVNMNFVRGASDHKLRYPTQKRIEFYNFLVDQIRSFDKDVSIGLCRETPEVWNILKNRCESTKCNCIIW
jgi:spore photoproduct lyase